MKEQFIMVHDGKQVGTQLAGYAGRAVELFAHKNPGMDRRYMEAVSWSDCPSKGIEFAIEMACLRTINFQPGQGA